MGGHVQRANRVKAAHAKVALLSYGSNAASYRRPIGTGNVTGAGNPTWQNNMEDPYGMTLIAGYAMVAHRHMHQYGTRSEDLARISVATRAHAMRNPQAPPSELPTTCARLTWSASRKACMAPARSPNGSLRLRPLLERP